MEINVVQKEKNKIKNVEVISLAVHNEYVHIAVDASIRELGFWNKFSSNYSTRLQRLVTYNLNNIYESRLKKNLNKTKPSKKVTKVVTKKKK